jgi:hypothetical protein
MRPKHVRYYIDVFDKMIESMPIDDWLKICEDKKEFDIRYSKKVALKTANQLANKYNVPYEIWVMRKKIFYAKRVIYPNKEQS